jgi:hypothetical protein
MSKENEQNLPRKASKNNNLNVKNFIFSFLGTFFLCIHFKCPPSLLLSYSCSCSHVTSAYEFIADKFTYYLCNVTLPVIVICGISTSLLPPSLFLTFILKYHHDPEPMYHLFLSPWSVMTKLIREHILKYLFYFLFNCSECGNCSLNRF